MNFKPMSSLARIFGRQKRGHAYPRQMSSIGFVLTTAAINTAIYHLPLVSYTLSNLEPTSLNGLTILVTVLVVLFTATTVALLILCIIAWPLWRPVCMLFALCNALALYFVHAYGVVLDKSMMGNVLLTNFDEAVDLFHVNLLFYVLIFGAMPCWLLATRPVKRASRLHLAAAAVVTATLGLTWTYLASSSWLWIDEHAKKLGGLIMPWSYVINTIRYQVEYSRASANVALLPTAFYDPLDPTIVVLVIGETARARNFSLYGYERNTNPEVAASGAVALRNATACSTYTRASLLCILSHKENGSEFSRRYEPLPSYLHRFGVHVIWRTNNWGEPPIQVNSYLKPRDLRKHCEGDACAYDEVLLTGLEEELESIESDRVLVVLHQRGSHGPVYYQEYPSDFEVFTPVCRSVDLSKCDPQTLANAYDNTILYTDHFLSRTISILKALGNPTVLLYVSDHGESLGEQGLYLHGTPLMIAPDVQTEIPFIVWMSPEFQSREGLSADDLLAGQQHSHRNVFHSIIGALHIQTPVYERTLDIFSTPEESD